MTYLVILSTYAASRATDIQQIRDQDGFVAVDSFSSRPESRSAAQQIAALGWDVDSETSRLRQLVRIRLPKEVDFSPYKFAGLTFYGLHTPAASSHDGNGRPSLQASESQPASARRAAMRQRFQPHWNPASTFPSRSRTAPGAVSSVPSSVAARSIPTIAPMISRPSSTHKPPASLVPPFPDPANTNSVPTTGDAIIYMTLRTQHAYFSLILRTTANITT